MSYARTRDGVRIYYEQHGRGTPLVLAYGIGGNADMWDVNREALAARHRLVLWEPRGHARSDSPEDPAKYSFAHWVGDLKAVLDHLHIRRAHVGGLSLGGGIATRFTLRHPAHVSSLLVTNSSSAAGLPLSVDNLMLRARSIEITLTKGMDAMAEFAMTANPNVSERLALDPNAKQEFYEEYRRLTPVGYANSLRALLAMDHITATLSRIRVPVLLIGGDRDPSLGPMKLMHQKVRGSRLVVLSPASHFANRDQPDAWNRAALEFLARCDGRPRALNLTSRTGH
ncbi:MAG TPA: alpha/beta fold hydrolase [Methylomirabilota bacterium]|jgi:pimeloyl-ACP methyl ester carboxylesterase|nr:alpha/beta fold hydrolase [Methylomirabilota bacterium]